MTDALPGLAGRLVYLGRLPFTMLRLVLLPGRDH